MSRSRYASYLSLLYVVGLLALVVVLAVLQYRWTGAASLAEQERMRQGLNESLALLEGNLDRDITRVVLAYWRVPTLPPDAGPSGWEISLAQALIDASHQWKSSATDSRLVSGVFIAESAAGSTPRLYSLQAGESRMAVTDWPEDLSRFKTVFQLQPEHDGPGERAGSDRLRRRLQANFVIDEIPALVRQLIPVAQRRERPGPEPVMQRSPGRRLWLIVCLDRDYLFNYRIPELAKRYLSRDGESPYDYVIRTAQERQLILGSSPGADTTSIVDEPDASVRLLRLHEEELDHELRTAEGGIRRRASTPSQGEGLPVEIPETGRIARERILEHRTHLQATAEIFASRGWELLAKHRSGSLNAAVAGTRLRNFGLSLGILLLLAVSLVILTVSVQRAQRLSRQQMEFVAGVSHELRTPIAVICSSAENLADGVVTSSEQVRRYGQYILREGWRLDTLVEQTLEFAGIGSGIRRFQLRPLDLNDIVNEAVEAFRAQISEKQLNIEVSGAPGAFVKGDAAALSCAIGNLISNAVKYSRPGGHVRVVLSRQQDTVVLNVADQGMGIEAGEVRRLFEPFFRGSNALKAQIRGAGIGLSLVKRIVDAHRGSIRVKSKIDLGSTFTLVLPAVPNGAVPDKDDAR